jgi:hypothetical protein
LLLPKAREFRPVRVQGRIGRARIDAGSHRRTATGQCQGSRQPQPTEHPCVHAPPQNEILVSAAFDRRSLTTKTRNLAPFKDRPAGWSDCNGIACPRPAQVLLSPFDSTHRASFSRTVPRHAACGLKPNGTSLRKPPNRGITVGVRVDRPIRRRSRLLHHVGGDSVAD